MGASSFGLRAAVVADDLTGAADSGVQLARAGYRTAVAFLDATIDVGDELDAIAADTDSRGVDPATAASRVGAVTRGLAGAAILLKKIDSTLRGPVGAEVAAALEASGRRAAIVAPASRAVAARTRSRAVVASAARESVSAATASSSSAASIEAPRNATAVRYPARASCTPVSAAPVRSSAMTAARTPEVDVPTTPPSSRTGGRG